MPSQKILQPSLSKHSGCVCEGKSNPPVTKTMFHIQILSGKFKCQTWFKKDKQLILHHNKQLKKKKKKKRLLVKSDKTDNLIF